MKSPAESPAAVDWSRARALLDDLRSSVRHTLATKVLLGKTLAENQKKLGFTQGGDRTLGAKTQPAFLLPPARTWGDWCKEELGISHDSAGRYIKCYEVVCRRAKNQKRPDILRLLKKPTEKLNGDEITALAARASFLVCDETETSLLAELKRLQEEEPRKRKSPAEKKGEEHKLTQIASRVIFTDVKNLYDQLKGDLHLIYSEQLGKALKDELPVTGTDEEVTLVGIRNCFSELVNDIESDLKTLVRTLDVEIEKRLPDAAKRLKAPTKNGPNKSK